jgi:hypothetical protein
MSAPNERFYSMNCSGTEKIFPKIVFILSVVPETLSSNLSTTCERGSEQTSDSVQLMNDCCLEETFAEISNTMVKVHTMSSGRSFAS